MSTLAKTLAAPQRYRGAGGRRSTATGKERPTGKERRREELLIIVSPGE